MTEINLGRAATDAMLDRLGDFATEAISLAHACDTSHTIIPGADQIAQGARKEADKALSAIEIIRNAPEQRVDLVDLITLGGAVGSDAAVIELLRVGIEAEDIDQAEL
jgi:hypothetical protein